MAPERALILLAVSTKVQASEDKVSIPEQERLMREYAAAQGIEIIEPPLIVPGHSRSESDIIDLLDEYAQEGLFAYHDLRNHWKAHDFDVLLAFDSSRVGRSLTLVTWVFENVINSAAHIYLIQGGRFDESNADMGIAMCAISAKAGIKRLVKLRDSAMVKRVSQGLPMTDIPMTHRLRRSDTTGKPIYMEVKEDMRAVWDDVATLVLQGVGWKKLSLELFLRFGHTNPETGKPYHDNTFYRMMHNPYTWGAAAKGYDGRYGLWAFDDAYPLPEGVIINRHSNPPVPPVYADDMAERLKDELRRRAEIIKGHASPRRSHKFSGLIICGSCGRRMAIEHKPSGHKIFHYWRCSTRKSAHLRDRHCENRAIRDEVVQVWLNTFLEVLEDEGGTAFLSLVEENDDQYKQSKQRIDRLNANVSSLHNKIESLINLQVLQTDSAVRDMYTRKIAKDGEQLRTLTIELQQATRTMAETQDELQARARGINEVASMTLDRFWESDPRFINQTLVRIMGSYRLVAMNGEITSIMRKG